jgi:hypothetical protein
LKFVRRMGLPAGDEIANASRECEELIAILASSIKTATRRQ